MKQKLLTFIVLIGLTIPAINALAQQTPDGYNPFVPANLDDELKLPEASVVEGSYHYYSVTGDAHYTAVSTFVWYVENGTLGTYDVATDTWTPLTGTAAISNGEFLELTGETLEAIANSSGVWIQWNDGSGGSTGYIAVYEKSADNCVFDNQITGFKHQILVPPEAWFIVGTREECSDQAYSITAQFNQLHENSYPYTLYYSYPDAEGFLTQTEIIIETADDLDASLQLHWEITGVSDGDATVDEVYKFTLDGLRDKYGASGEIAPLGEASLQYNQISITILHLPQTGGMTME